MQTIRKSIYVGLGGAGVRAIAQTKRMFEDSFGVGCVPPQIAFLAFDFDKSVLNDKTLATDVSESFVSLPQAVNPFRIYHSTDKRISSVFPQNASFLPEYIDCGAAQVRSNGFFFARIVKKSIDAALHAAMAQVLSFSNSQAGYNVTDDEYVNVYIASSLVGGTGSAMMIDVAATIRESYGKARLHGYGISHSVYQVMDPMGILTPRIKSNVYATILELDYMQSATLENPAIVNFYGRKFKVTSPLFDEFYVVDNRTQSGALLSDVKDLCLAIGYSMYYGACDMGGYNAIDWTRRALQWNDKQSWVHCFGVCQIVYKGEELVRRYRLLASLKLLSKIQGSASTTVADAWMWLERASLREDGDDYNKLIESICPSDDISRVKTITLDPNDSVDELKIYLDKYLASRTVLWEKNRVEDILNKAISDLHIEVDRLSSGDGGLRNVIAFLQILSDCFHKYKGEMNSECEDFRNKAKSTHAHLLSLSAEFESCRKRWITKLTGERKSVVESIASVAHQYVKHILQAKRREDAALIFTHLINEVDRLASLVNGVLSMVGGIENGAQNFLRKEVHEQSSASLFEVDLSADDMRLLHVDDGDVSYCDFISNISSWINIDKEMIINALVKYTETLPQVKRYRECNVCDIIDRMSDTEYLELKKQIFRKSSPLLPLSDRGLLNGTISSNSPIANMMKDFFIHYYCTNPEYKNRLEGDSLLGTGNNTKVKFVPTNDPSARQRINIHRVDSAIMPYCIEFLDYSVKDEYLSALKDKAAYHPHVSSQLYDAISNAGFKLEPAE